MKKTKVLVPAMGLLLSTAASITGTVAWFAVNTSVSVTGLQVQAKAEGGIVIAPYTVTNGSSVSDEGSVGYNDHFTDAVYTAPAANVFTNTATLGLAAAELFPTSTANASAWYHGTSASVDNYAAVNESYAQLGGEAGKTLAADGKYYLGTGTNAENAYRASGQYFLYNKFKVKSTSDDTFSLYVSRITISADTATAALNKSIRVAVKAGEGSVAFFAPKYAANDETVLYYYSGTARTAGSPTKGSNADFATRPQVANNTVNLTGIDLQIWVYYEGEDENLKTTNAAGFTVDTLAISMNFTTAAN